MKIIAFAGMPGSGKSLATEYGKSLGIQSIRLGDYTDEELQKRGLERNEKNERVVREDLRKQFGMNAYAKWASENAEQMNGPVILDGIRSYEEYLFLKEKYGKEFTVVSIMVPANIRYGRLENRLERPLTEQECRSRDLSEIKNLNHAGTVVMGDYFIVNSGTKEEFKIQIISYLEKFIKTRSES